MKIAGLDIGTTGCKLTVFDHTGRQLARYYCGYPASRKAGAHEIDANGILEGVFSVLRAAAEEHREIAGIGVTSFGETCILTDQAGVPLRPAMLYTDPRGAEECARLTRQLGEERLIEISGTRPHEMYSLPKIMWIKAHEPEVYARTRHIFLVEDFVVFHLTGQRVIDHSLAARTMGFDIRKLQWSREISGYADRLHQPRPGGGGGGGRRIFLRHGRRRRGHRGVHHPHLRRPARSGGPGPGKLCGGALCPPREVRLLRLFLHRRRADSVVRRHLGQKGAGGSGGAGNLCQPAAGEPVQEPHFAGAATPYMDTGSKGAILGLTTETTAADLYRGCMEGVVYEMLLNTERLAAAGVHFQKLSATGGGARSREWMQMKADVLNRELTALETADAGTVGSAMLTGVAVGCFSDLAGARSRMVREIGVFRPRADLHAAYQEIYRRYRQVYEAVRPLV